METFNLDEYLQDLELLVNIDSGSYYVDGVNRIAEFFVSRFESLGMKVSLLDFNPAVAPCLEASNTDADDAILLLGHMDTVFSQGTVAERPFSKDESRAYGPGVADMKSGLLYAYYALKLIPAAQRPAVRIAFNSHEEISSRFCYEWMQDLAKKSRVTYVLEPSRSTGAIVNKRKGLAKLDVAFRGVAAHAGVEPEKGRSAVTEMAHWILELNKFNNPEKETTVNPGVVTGGTQANVVAQDATLAVDVRFKDQSELEKIEARLTELSQSTFVPDLTASFVRAGWRPPMNPTPESDALYAHAKKLAAEIGFDLPVTATGGGSDGNFTAAAGCVTLDGMGPVGGGAHGISEYIELSSIEPRIQLLCQLMLTY